MSQLRKTDECDQLVRLSVSWEGEEGSRAGGLGVWRYNQTEWHRLQPVSFKPGMSHST